MPEIHRTMFHSNRRRNKSVTKGFSLYCSNVIDIIKIINWYNRSGAKYEYQL